MVCVPVNLGCAIWYFVVPVVRSVMVNMTSGANGVRRGECGAHKERYGVRCVMRGGVCGVIFHAKSTPKAPRQMGRAWRTCVFKTCGFKNSLSN